MNDNIIIKIHLEEKPCRALLVKVLRAFLKDVVDRGVLRLLVVFEHRPMVVKVRFKYFEIHHLSLHLRQVNERIDAFPIVLFVIRAV